MNADKKAQSRFFFDLGKLWGLRGAMAWCAVHPDAFSMAYQISAQCLAIAGAVVSADYIVGWRCERARRMDGVGTLAMISGIAAPFLLSLWTGASEEEQWWYPWLFPSYGVAFLICAFGRVVERTITRGARIPG